VLEEGGRPVEPVARAAQVLAIFSSNLDEFFEIRWRAAAAGIRRVEPQDYGAERDGPAEQLAAIDRRTHELVAEQYRILNDEVLPASRRAACSALRLRI